MCEIILKSNNSAQLYFDMEGFIFIQFVAAFIPNHTRQINKQEDFIKHNKVCIRIMLYQQILSRATPKCVEQLKCGEQKFIEDILNDRWQHHIQRQVLGIFAVYNF